MARTTPAEQETQFMKPRITLILMVLSTIAAVSAQADSASKCFASWSDAAPVVKREALVAVEQVSALARPSLSGAEIVKTTLCEEQGRYIYRLLVREAKGHLKTVSVDARTPFGR